MADLEDMLNAMDNGELEADAVFAAALSPDALREATGFEDLTCVTAAELRVDAAAMTLGVLGELLPQVVELRLSRSSVPTCRELGTKLTRLKRLWLNNSHVQLLQGVQFIHQLSELYIAFNNVESLAPLGALLNLEVLDAEGNNVSDRDELGALAGLSELTSLTLLGNPLVAGMGEAYRADVMAALPQLSVLDDCAIDEAPPAALLLTGRGHDAAEAILVTAAIRAQRDLGVTGMVDEQHRSLVSRQSSSAAGVRMGSTAPVGSARQAPATEASLGGRAALSSAPMELGSPAKGGRPPPSPPTLGGTASPQSALASGVHGSMSGNITRSLRRGGPGSQATMSAVLEPVDGAADLIASPSTGIARGKPRKHQQLRRGSQQGDAPAAGKRAPPGNSDDDDDDDDDDYSDDVDLENDDSEEPSDDCLSAASSEDDEHRSDRRLLNELSAGIPKIDSEAPPTAAAPPSESDDAAVQAWEGRLTARGAALAVAPASLLADGTQRMKMTDAEVLAAVKLDKTVTTKQLQQDMLVDALGENAAKSGTFEAIDLGDGAGVEDML
jgi:hypothetical protein